MKEESPEGIEQKSPSEQVNQILKEAVQKIRGIIKETVVKVDDFPKSRLGKLDDPKSWNPKGKFMELPGIWINWSECNSYSRINPFVLTKKGLFRSTYNLF